MIFVIFQGYGSITSNCRGENSFKIENVLLEKTQICDNIIENEEVLSKMRLLDSFYLLHSSLSQTSLAVFLRNQ